MMSTVREKFQSPHADLQGKALQENINLLHELYAPINLDPATHRNKVLAVKKLNYILRYTNSVHLQEVEFQELVECALTAIYYFGMRLNETEMRSKYNKICARKQYQKAKAAFQKTLEYLEPENCDIAIQITFRFLTSVSLWPYESFVVHLFDIILHSNRSKMMLFNYILTDIHCVLFTDVEAARHRMRVMYEMLKSSNWVVDKQRLLPFVTRMLDFYAITITSAKDNMSMYKYMRKGFEVCLRQIFERTENLHRLTLITTMLNWFSMVTMSDEDVLEFSLVLDCAAEFYVVRSYIDSFTEGLVDFVLRRLVGSRNALFSLIGCRVLQRFLDRLKNMPHLHTPILYYEYSQVKLNRGAYDSGDKIFLRQHREIIHECFISAIRKHSHSIVNLIAVFNTICCMVLEVPCGLTAAAASCLMMSVQDFALNGENLLASTRYWLHAIVISVMSLICWVHRAPNLYDYVNKIIYRRAKEAPQLNPPLLPEYNFSIRHITWNKPIFFFEDWELRYGLWKHFQDSKAKFAKLQSNSFLR